VQQKLSNLIEELTEQVRLIRASIYSINKDTSGKETALVIDKHCAQLTETYPNLNQELDINERK